MPYKLLRSKHMCFNCLLTLVIQRDMTDRKKQFIPCLEEIGSVNIMQRDILQLPFRARKEKSQKHKRNIFFCA